MIYDKAESFVSMATKEPCVFYKRTVLQIIFLFFIKLWEENGMGSGIFGQYNLK